MQISSSYYGFKIHYINEKRITIIAQRFNTHSYFLLDITVARTILTLENSIEWIRYHNESSLIAISLDNCIIVLLDMDTKKIVRRFGHETPVTDACFNPDSRWLITASTDGIIRTWDIPSSHLIDIFEVYSMFTFIYLKF